MNHIHTPHEAGADVLASSMTGENRMTTNYPPKFKDLVCDLTDHGWDFVVQHGKDTGDHPYIHIDARRDDRVLYVTWHTRATGTYRLFSCMVNKRDVTLTKAFAAVTA